MSKLFRGWQAEDGKVFDRQDEADLYEAQLVMERMLSVGRAQEVLKFDDWPKLMAQQLVQPHNAEAFNKIRSAFNSCPVSLPDEVA